MHRLRKWLQRILPIAAVVTVMIGSLSTVSAQGGTPLVVSLPTIWEDLLTDEVLAEFEAQFGVDVIPQFDQNTFGFFGGGEDVEAHLDGTEEFVNSADVLYIDSSALTYEDTLAGYFLDLMPLAQSDPALDSNDFISGAWQSYQWDSGLWALPVSVDAVITIYDPTAFDAVGLAYPNERWTMDDYAHAARLLTTYAPDGTVETPGFTTNAGGNNLDAFLRSLSNSGLYDPTSSPSMPSFGDPVLAANLTTWYELQQEGVVATTLNIGGGGGNDNEIPLQIAGVFGYRLGRNQNQDATPYDASLLAGGVAALNVQGFAVSAGTQYPEVAYELAKFLTTRPEIATSPFSVAPARYSLDGVAATNGNGNGNGGGFANATIPDTIQPTIDQGLMSALPVAEMRYSTYLSTALNQMNAGLDALSALQTAEAQAIANVDLAAARKGNVYLAVTPPITSQPLQAGEIALTCAVNFGFGGGRGGQAQLPNHAEWDTFIESFVANDPVVAAVYLETTNSTDLTTLGEAYDCILLSTNAVPGADLTPILNLDPLIDTDASFDRNDVIGNTLAQLQSDSKTWALPLAIQPQMLEYDPQKFAQVGVPEPINGWTAETFVDALRMLKPYDTDPIPFNPNDPSGSYIMMLIGAFGGLPLDYRTDPVTVNFTEPANVDAIRQVLNLAMDGYISYSGLNNVAGGGIALLDTSESAITTNVLSSLARGFNFETTTTELTTTSYPQGSVFGVIAYEVSTGYISATAQNPEAAYRFLSDVSRNPQLFSGMPARQSLVFDPVVAAAQGPEVVAVYQQLDLILRNPNTIVFPTFTGGGRGALSFIDGYWLNQAMDNYVLNGADLEFELSEAEIKTKAYQACAAGIVIDQSGVQGGQEGGGQGQIIQQIAQCATLADPDFSLGG